jgi:hypothetical protein
MKAIVLGCFLCLAAINPAAAQPAPSPTPGIGTLPSSRFLTERLARQKAALKADIARRIDRSTFDRSHPVSSIPAAKLVDTRLGTAVAGFQQRLDQLRLQQIAARKRDPQFLGVIDSMKIGDIEISLERRNVRTARGVQNLLLTRFGNQYVYDGDMVVPWSAIQFGGFTAQSAGVAGTFGKGTLWDDAIIPFEVESAFCCMDALRDAILFYEQNTIFQFVQRTGEDTYVRFINADPFTTSRTDNVGKRPGENPVRIQGTSLSGGPVTGAGLIANIQHEMGHVLGLIHEHLRSDRDKFIARNPACTSGNMLQSVREAWIDVGQSTFVDDSAELLTPYDFDSVMHYQFLLDMDGDGASDCSTWVRIATCPNNDPTSSACNGTFASLLQLTAQDIEGLHKLYAAVPNDPDVKPFHGNNVRHRGRKIDRCLQGLPLGKDGCSAEARGQVADAFCKTKGYDRGVSIVTESAWGEHSGYDPVTGWKNVWGTDVISSLTCEGRLPDKESVSSGELESRTFPRNEVKVSDRPVDRCVHGNGIVGDRCSEDNQKRVADRFCQRQDFEHSSLASTDFSAEANAIGFHPSTNDFRNVSSLDIFTEVTCVRHPSSTVPTSQEFSGSQVMHRGKRIDRCLQGTSFGEDGCSQAALNRVAAEFCRVKGFQDAKQIQIQGDVGEHSLFDKVVGWKNAWGTDAISFVRCENLTNDAADVGSNALESRVFSGTRLRVSSRPIDRCMHGDGITGDRCGIANQRRIASKFCQLNAFNHSSGFATDARVEINAIGFHPKSGDFQNASSTDVFTEITCVRPPA